jgi:ubiquinone/menaquinone biosynthesis C-methylase UbiE
MSQSTRPPSTPAIAATHTYARSPDPTGEDRAYLDFVLGLKQHWARSLYPKLHAQYDEAAGQSEAARPATAEEAGPVVRGLPAYPFFGWLERNAQKMMWRRLEGIIRPQEPTLATALEASVPEPLGTLELDPDLKLPAYYEETEFHIQPGGVWSGVANAYVYEVGAKIVMMGQNDDYLFHRRFVETAIPRDRAYTAILDLGCGFGKSTRPFVDAFPDAEVVGIDLSAPNLQLAHQQSERLGKKIAFKQRAAEATGFADRSFDLVTGTMLIHEVPMPVLRAILQEAARLLRPGGLVAFLDFQRTRDPFRDFAMDEHGARNNEPYMPHLFRIDLSRLLRSCGFEQIEILPFDERGAGLIESGEWPARSEWHFPWSVIRATRTETGTEG